MITQLTLPKFKIDLPMSKRKVEIRPFTVKEENILLLASEEGTIEAITNSMEQIFSNCTFDKESIDSMSKIDAEYLYVQIRNRSMGEGVTIKGICKECKHKTPIILEYDKVQVANKDYKSEPVKLTDNVWVTLKLPSLKDSFVIAEKADSVVALAYAIDTIIEDDEAKNASDYSIEERVEFIESMTASQIELFKPFFDNMPVLYLNVDYTCKCGVENHIHIEGVENFFA